MFLSMYHILYFPKISKSLTDKQNGPLFIDWSSLP